MPYGDTYLTGSGTLLARDVSGYTNFWVKLFLKDVGIIYTTAPRASGETEPFIWGHFYLKKKSKGKGYYIFDTEILDDMFFIRKSKQTILTSFKWTNAILKYLLPEHPDNNLLANLYWSMKLLSAKHIPIEAIDWRFTWKWLEGWGLAPDLVSFHSSKNFNRAEIILLTQISMLNVQGVMELFTKPLDKEIRENVFKVASRLAEGFLIEK